MYDYDYNDYDYDYSVNYADGYTTTEWGNSYTTIDNPALDQIYAILPVIGIISSILGLFMIISTWRIFKKAGKHGWASIVPIYNFIVLIEVAGLPLWYFILFLIPFVNIYAMFKIYIELAHKFGKGTCFGVLSIFFPIICLPILAFGKCKYEGNDNNTSTTITNTDNNNGVNETQFQNMVSNSELQTSTMSNNGFNPEPAVPSFIPTNDISNNMQNEIGITENTNSVVNETYSKTLPENINNTLNNQNIMWEVNSPVYDNNVSVPNNQVETVNVNHTDNNFSNMNETVTNTMNNNVNNVVVDNNLNTISSESNNPTVENAIPSNINQTIVPEIPNIDNVQNMDNTINSGANEVSNFNNNGEVNLTTNNQNVNVIPSLEEVGSNLVSEKPPVNIEINNIPINSVEQNNNELPSNQVINEPVVSEINVMNNPINNEEQNVIPEIQSIPNIPVEDNSKKNITDTMSLNELLAEINIEEQK